MRRAGADRPIEVTGDMEARQGLRVRVWDRREEV